MNEGIRHSLKQEFGKLLTTSPDLSIGNLDTTEEGVSPQQTINSIDMGFTLINEKNLQRSPSVEEVKAICDIYPGVTDVLHFPPYLRVVCETLPEQIPRTLAGIPCQFTTNPDEIPLRGTFCRGPAISLGSICPPWILPPFNTRKKIAQHLVSSGVRSVGWLGTRWLLEVESEDDGTARNLPCKINGLIASYHCLPASEEHSRRHIFPSRTEVDDTDYFPNLHAGMLLFQGGDGGGYSTSGCPVKHVDHPNDRFFTVASHGFVLGAEVIHPHAPPNGRIVAIVDKQMGHSDISLAKIIDPAIAYTAESFAGPDGTIRLKELRREQDCMIAEELFLDSPFTGLATGIVVAHGVAVYPKDGIDEKWAYVSNIWTDFTASVYDPVAGSCGTPLYNKGGGVVAFFRWFDNAGISTCPTPDSLIKAGWELAHYEHPGPLVPADADSYGDYLQKRNAPDVTATSCASTITPSRDLFGSHHHLTEDIEDKLGKLPSKSFVTEMNNYFTATFLHSAVLLSWHKAKDMFPDASDVEEHVEGGWGAKKISVEEWNSDGDYDDIVQVVKDVAKQDNVQVYKVQGRKGKFEVFVLAKIHDGLIGVKAMGVAA